MIVKMTDVGAMLDRVIARLRSDPKTNPDAIATLLRVRVLVEASSPVLTPEVGLEALRVARDIVREASRAAEQATISGLIDESISYGYRA